MAELAGLGARTVHVAVDVQRLFTEPAGWRVPDMASIVPRIAELARAKPGRTLFTRFTVPRRADEAPGHWRRFYEHWSDVTATALQPGMMELVDQLAALADEASTVDKPTYSAFEAPAFTERLASLGADTIIFTGVETEICVLGTLLTAVDRGFRVIAVEDAMASSSIVGHEATLRHILPRFDQQVEIAKTAAVLAAWN